MIYFKRKETVEDILENMQEEAGPYIEKFCQKYNLGLTSISKTKENGNLEPIFYFTDNLGGYTIEGIRCSLEE